MRSSLFSTLFGMCSMSLLSFPTYTIHKHLFISSDSVRPIPCTNEDNEKYPFADGKRRPAGWYLGERRVFSCLHRFKLCVVAGLRSSLFHALIWVTWGHVVVDRFIIKMYVFFFFCKNLFTTIKGKEHWMVGKKKENSI